MKKILITMSMLIFVLSSCINRGNNSEAPVNAVDSVAIRDSLCKVAFIREEENKVLGDLRFLISKEEYYRNAEKYFAPYKGNYGYHIGNYEFFLYRDVFFEDKLYYIQLLGSHVKYEDYDDGVPRDFRSIYDVYHAKYGDPDIRISIPANYELKTGHSYRIAEWRIGRKTVQIRLVEDRYSYRIDLDIFRSDIVDRLKEKKQSEESAKTEAAVDLI
jgi:hypothetical protein